MKNIIQRIILMALLVFTAGSIWAFSTIQVSASTVSIISSGDGRYFYAVDGIVDIYKSGLAQVDGRWYYLEEGQWITNKYAFVEYGGGKFLVANGLVATDKKGLVQDPENKNDWYFLTNGQVTKNKNGLAQYNGAWFYVENGKLDTTYNGFVTYDGGMFFVARGKLQNTKNGLTQDPNNKADWYFLANGQVQSKKTGLVGYDGKWFYVQNGKLVPGYTGSVEYNGATFYLFNGEIVDCIDYTTLTAFLGQNAAGADSLLVNTFGTGYTKDDQGSFWVVRFNQKPKDVKIKDALYQWSSMELDFEGTDVRLVAIYLDNFAESYNKLVASLGVPASAYEEYGLYIWEVDGVSICVGDGAKLSAESFLSFRHPD